MKNYFDSRYIIIFFRNFPFPTDLLSTQPTANIPNTVNVNQPAVNLPYPTVNKNKTRVKINPPTFDESVAGDNENSYQKQQSFDPYFKNAQNYFNEQ